MGREGCPDDQNDGSCLNAAYVVDMVLQLEVSAAALVLAALQVWASHRKVVRVGGAEPEGDATSRDFHRHIHRTLLVAAVLLFAQSLDPFWLYVYDWRVTVLLENAASAALMWALCLWSSALAESMFRAFASEPPRALRLALRTIALAYAALILLRAVWEVAANEFGKSAWRWDRLAAANNFGAIFLYWVVCNWTLFHLFAKLRVFHVTVASGTASAQYVALFRESAARLRSSTLGINLLLVPLLAVLIFTIARTSSETHVPMFLECIHHSTYKFVSLIDWARRAALLTGTYVSWLPLPAAAAAAELEATGEEESFSRINAGRTPLLSRRSQSVSEY
jgi:hypothetical protein